MSEQSAERLAETLRQESREAQASQSRYLSELATTAQASRATAEVTREDPAMTVLTDRSLPVGTRAEVLDRLGPWLSRRDEFIAALFAIVRDRDDSPAMREAALQALGSAAFQVVRFRPHRQAYDDTLHDLVTDPVQELREAATGVLAQEHDPVVQDALLEGLRGNRALPVDREQAILLLAEDDHLDNLPWLRELYASGSESAREQAVRFMGSYPEARTTLEGVLRDKSEAPSVRQQSGAALRYLTPDRFDEVAKEIATDTTDDPDVRTASLRALQHLGDTDRVYADSDFVDRVRDVGSDESAPEVAEVARDLLAQRPDQ